MEPTVLRFVAFIFSGILFFIVVTAAATAWGYIIAKKGFITAHQVIFVGLIAVILNSVFLIFFTWILTGDGHPLLFGGIGIISVVMILLTELVWLIFGSSDIPWVGRMIWMQYESRELAPWASKILLGLSILAFVFYPVYIGIGYFGNEFGSGDWLRYVIRGTLIFLFIVWLMQLPNLIYLMTSRNIMEGTRSRLFMVNLGNSLYLLVLSSVFIWTIKSAGATFPVLGNYFVFSSTVGYAVGGYLLVLVVFPYIIGHYTAKHWVEHLDNEWRDLIDEVTKGFSSLNMGKAIKSLDESENSAKAILQALYDEKSLALANQVAQSNDEDLFIQRWALEEGIKRDPRIVHSTRLEEVIEHINDCRTELSTKKTEGEKRKVLKRCIENLEKEKEKGASTGDSTKKSWVIVMLSSMVTLVVINPVLSSVGKLVTVRLGLPQ